MKSKIPTALLHSVMVDLGRKGGKARAKKVSKKKLSEIGRKGALARWKKANKT